MFKYSRIVFVLLFSIISTTVYAAEPNLCLKRVETALTYMKAGQLDKAIEELRDTSRLHPGLAVVECQLGFACIAKKDWVNAEAQFVRALAIRPDYGNALYGMALVCMKKKSVDESIEYLEKSVKAGPRISDRYVQLGTLRLSKNDVAGAVSDLRQAIDLDASNVQALNNLGGILVLQGKSSEGIGLMQSAISIAPNYAQTHNNLGFALMGVNKDYSGAEKEFRRAIQLQPNDFGALQNLGTSLFLQKRYSDAAIVFEGIIKAKPAAAKSHYYLAAIDSIQSKAEDAIAHLSKALELDSSLKKSAMNERSFENIKNLVGFKKLFQ